MAILRTVPSTGCELPDSTIDVAGRLELAEVLSERIVHTTLAGESCEWRVMRHHYYAVPGGWRKHNMNRAIDMCLADEQSIVAYCKLAATLPYLGGCGTTEGIVLLELYQFDSSW